jgi:hypothetical protein
MTAEEQTPKDEKAIESLEEICENTRAIRRVVNRILDHLHEYYVYNPNYDEPDKVGWDDMDEYDDMYL